MKAIENEQEEGVRSLRVLKRTMDMNHLDKTRYIAIGIMVNRFESILTDTHLDVFKEIQDYSDFDKYSYTRMRRLAVCFQRQGQRRMRCALY